MMRTHGLLCLLFLTSLALLKADPTAAGGVRVTRVLDVPALGVRLVLNPADRHLYYLNPYQGLFRVDLSAEGAPAWLTRVQAPRAIVADATLAGFAFGADGTAYAVANREVGVTQTQAVILRGVPAATGFTWSALASTEPYALSAAFDHTFNGIAVSPDGRWVFVNSGSRTDHGEVESNAGAFPGLREIPLTSAVFRLPADSAGLVLKNDEVFLKPYLFADGLRNAYDLEFAPNGELFAGDNGPDADYPDEFNLLSAGAHYGFPWRFGAEDNAQRSPGYDPALDRRLSPDFKAVQNGSYRNDPGFPPPPAPFSDPIVNLGPAGAALGTPAFSLTPHRSPLGLVFAPAPGPGLDAYLLSFGAAGGRLGDPGRDLLHLVLTKKGDRYEMTASVVVSGFNNPIDAVFVGDRLYVLEWGQGAGLWEVTLPSDKS